MYVAHTQNELVATAVSPAAVQYFLDGTRRASHLSSTCIIVLLLLPWLPSGLSRPRYHSCTAVPDVLYTSNLLSF